MLSPVEVRFQPCPWLARSPDQALRLLCMMRQHHDHVRTLDEILKAYKKLYGKEAQLLDAESDGSSGGEEEGEE